MGNYMFSGIFRGLKIKNREKSQSFTQLVEAAGVFFNKNTPSRCLKEFSKIPKKRHFRINLYIKKHVRKFKFNIFRGFFGDFYSSLCPLFERGCTC